MKSRADVSNVRDGLKFAKKYGFPIKLFSAYSLRWQRIANDRDQLRRLVEEGLRKSPIRKVRLQRV